MELRTYPAEALMLIEIANILKSQMKAIALSQTTINNNSISDNKVELETYINVQDIVISDQELFTKCTSSEWHLIGRITKDLRLNNAIWKCPIELKSNGTIQKAIKGLRIKNILTSTNTTHFYIVNPLVLRRGRDWKVAITTAQAIHDNNGIDDSLIRDLRPIDKFDFVNNNNPPQRLSYGYTPDTQ